MPWLAALGGAVGGVASSLIGSGAASGDYSAEQQQIQEAIDAYKNIGVPPTQALQIVFQKYQNSGQMTPAMESAFQQSSNAYNNIQTNPQDNQAQLNALNSLQNTANQGGMNTTEQANLQQNLSDIASRNRGAQDAISQQAQARGQFGGGQQLVSQEMAAQNGANQANQMGLNINAQAQQNALSSLMGAGQLGGQMQAQQWGQGAQAAAAQNAINQFNTQNAQNVGNYNVGAQNNAQLYNLQNQQQTNNLNTQGQNQTNQYNSQAYQQNFNDNLQKANGLAGQYGKMGNYYGQQGQNQQNMWGGIGQAINDAGTAVGSYLQGKQDNNNEEET